MRANYEAQLDETWGALEPHIAWPEGLAVLLLYTSHPHPVDELRGRAEAMLRAGGCQLRLLQPRTLNELSTVLEELLVRPAPTIGALWVELWWGSGAPNWDTFILTLLNRLNERRAALEREVARPTVLVLPKTVRERVFEYAPDLWTIRSFTAKLPSPPIETEDSSITQAYPLFALSPPSPAEKEWVRLVKAKGDPSKIDAWDGIRAFEAAIQRSSSLSARRIALQTLALLLGRLDDVETWSVDDAIAALEEGGLEPSSELRYAVRNLGVVERELGHFDSARRLFRFGLESTRAMSETTGVHGFGRESFWLERLGYVELEARNLPEARALFQRALEICNRLAENSPKVTNYRRLSLCYTQLGDVERQLQHIDTARAMYRRALELSEDLFTKEPSLSAERDLSLALNRLGGIEQQAGRLSAARSLFQRAIDIRERRARAVPDRLDARIDLLYAHKRFIKLGRELGDIELQREHLTKARAILQPLIQQGLVKEKRRLVSMVEFLDQAEARLNGEE